MFHRESDEAKVEENRDTIFALHATALSWLEEYTGIQYPFSKLDFVLIPAFQFGGWSILDPSYIGFHPAARTILHSVTTTTQG